MCLPLLTKGVPSGLDQQADERMYMAAEEQGELGSWRMSASYCWLPGI